MQYHPRKGTKTARLHRVKAHGCLQVAGAVLGLHTQHVIAGLQLGEGAVLVQLCKDVLGHACPGQGAGQPVGCAAVDFQRLVRLQAYIFQREP